MKAIPSIRSGALALALALPLATARPAQASLTQIRSELVARRLDEPVFVTAPRDDPRLFVVERAGRVVILEEGERLDTPFLDLRGSVSTSGLRGMFGLAFAPDYASSGLFYVLYTGAGGVSVLSRFSVSADPDVADPTEEVLLTIDQPYADKNGGTVAFGPDGFLYLSPGDGGSYADPDERAQDPGSLLGKMLRIDVAVPPDPGSIPTAGGAYAIPADNPYRGVAGAREEIWALGLQNPFRFSFDRKKGDLWIADAGDVTGELDFEPAGDPGGRNYGWDVEDGTACNPDDPAPAPPCGDESLTPPVFERAMGGDSCRLVGGFVHRGSAYAVQGHFLFGDFCSGRIWSYDPASGVATERTAELGAAGGTSSQLMGFGEDGFGESYVVLRGFLVRSGTVHRIVSAPAECGDGIDNDGDGRVDTDDPGCLHARWPEEDPACSNGLDDDGDGAVDLDDDGCHHRPWWIVEETPPLACGLLGGEALALPLLLLAARRRLARRSGDRG